MEPAKSIDDKYKIDGNRFGILTLSGETIFILISVVLAFLLRLFLIPEEPTFNADSVHFLALAKNVVHGDLAGAIHAYWPPLYPFLTGVTSVFFKDFEFAGRFVSVVAGTLLLVPVYYLIRDMYGRVPAYYGTVIVLIHPWLVVSSGWALTESLYTLIFTTVVFTGWKALKSGNAVTYFITGLLLGAAYLTKPEALGFLTLFLIFTIAAKFRRQNLTFRLMGARFLLVVFGLAIFLLPYVVVIHQKTGRWTFSEKMIGNTSLAEYEQDNFELVGDGQTTRQDQLVGTNRGEYHQVNNSSPQVAELWTERRFDFVKFVSTTSLNIKKEVKEYLPSLFAYPLFLLAIIGVFYKPWTESRAAKELYLLSFLIATLVGYALAVVEERYLYSIIPLLTCWISNGIVSFSDWASISIFNFPRSKQKVNPVIIQVFTFLISVVIWIVPPVIQNKFHAFPKIPEKQAGLWIKTHKTSSSLIMAPNPIVAYYAEEESIFLPNEEFSNVLQYAIRKNVRYLVINSKNLGRTPKIVIPDDEDLPQNLKLVYRYDQDLSCEILVYQLLN